MGSPHEPGRKNGAIAGVSPERSPVGSGRASAEAITASVLENVSRIVDRAHATAVFVYADAIGKAALDLPAELSRKVVYVGKSADEVALREDGLCRTLRVPDVPLTRTGQMKIAVFLALSRGLVRPGDVIVFLGGIARSGTLDTILITELGREFEMYAAMEHGNGLPADVLLEALERVIDMAAQLGSEGREGKPVGVIFVVGDAQNVLPLTRQLILNPFRGYSEDERNLLNPDLEETVKELSTIDGAFIVRGNGVIETCGAYLKTTGQATSELPRGLGARHHAAAGITAVTDAIAVTVSESTGTVTIFRHGRPITEIEKPRSTADERDRFVSRSSGE